MPYGNCCVATASPKVLLHWLAGSTSVTSREPMGVDLRANGCGVGSGMADAGCRQAVTLYLTPAAASSGVIFSGRFHESGLNRMLNVW